MKVTNLPDVPFPPGITGSVKLPKTQTSLINCWNVEGDIINRPGITQLNTTSLVARGQFVWNDNLYQVVSTSLIKITDLSTGAYSVIGTITGTEDIDVAIGFNHACIIVKGGSGYTLDNTDTLTIMVSAQFVASDSVAHINGRFVFIPSDGSVAFFSDVGDADSIQVTSFFDAEQLPDKNTVCFNLNNLLYIGGTDSFEIFRDTGAGLVPYSRLDGRVSFGYISGILEYADTALFVGREKNQDVGIYAISQGTAQKISNEMIDSALITYTTAQLQTIKVNRFKWLGYDIATFRLANNAWGYNGGWFELTTQVANEPKPWDADFITHHKQKYYIANDDKIGVLADTPTDYGNKFEGTVIIGFEEDSEFSVSSLEMNISQGYNTSIGSVALELSHDNVLWTEPFYRETGRIGEYSRQLKWEYPGGLGYYYGFMGIKLTTTENINFSASKLMVNV
jgi:hypothetical protein